MTRRTVVRGHALCGTYHDWRRWNWRCECDAHDGNFRTENDAVSGHREHKQAVRGATT